MAEAPRSVVDVVTETAQAVYAALGEGHSEATYHAAMTVELRMPEIRLSQPRDIRGTPQPA